MTPGIRTLILMAALGSVGAWAQDSSAPPATPDNGSQSQEPVPAYGQEGQLPAVTENPPISGLDTPSLEPHTAPLSYLQPGATVSESIDTNPTTSLQGQETTSVSRGLGSLALQRVWSHYDLAADYIGGAAYYDRQGQGFKALQQADVQQKLSWKRGELNLRDSFSYLPEGNFGGAYGSIGSQGIASLGTTAFSSFFGGTTLGTLGLVPRITNVALGDLSEYLSPKGAITAIGGYGLTHFYGSATNAAEEGALPANTYFIGNSQVSAQAGYSRVLSAQTQVALMYGYQAFDFSTAATAFHSNIIQLMYGHRVTGRLDFLIAAGPQFTALGVPGEVCSRKTIPPGLPCELAGYTNEPTTITDNRIGAAGRLRLRYKFTKTTLQGTYERYETPGSGIFAGAHTDLAILSAERPLTRVWSLSADMGYARNVRLEPSTEGVDATSYTYGFLGGALHRQFGHDFHAFVSYQFNELAFDHSFCDGVVGACNRISPRQVATFGLDWTPRPLRLD